VRMARSASNLVLSSLTTGWEQFSGGILGASIHPRSVHSSSPSKITLRFFCASTSIF